MHFSRHRSGDCTRVLILGPIERRAVAVGEEFNDRKAVPNDNVAIPEDRYLAEGGRELIAFTPFVPILIEHRHDQLLELLARLLAGEPAAERPAGVGTIADDQLEQSFTPKTSRLRGLPFVI